MILFINGFEIVHWGKHEIAVRNKQCYDAVGTVGGVMKFSGLGGAVAAQGAGYGYCVTQSFQENKQGNVYSPARDITANAPYYQGKEMEYWNPVKDQISKGFHDSRLFFINGSSDNRTTGNYRFQVGVQIGQKIIDNWRFLDSFNEKFRGLGEKKHEVSRLTNLDAATRNGLRQYYQISTDQLIQELGKRNAAFKLQGSETLKIIGHSMGAAIAAGIATVISQHPVYGKKIAVVLYLAPHQPQDFQHPVGVKGYQSSSAEDLVASKNEIGHITIPVGDPGGIALYNWLSGTKKPLPYSVEVPVSIEWAKGKTAYQIIKNIPRQRFIRNKTHDGLKSQRGHGVYTYADEIKEFFKLFDAGI